MKAKRTVFDWVAVSFGALFGFSFVMIFMNIIFNKSVYRYNTFILLLLISAFVCLLLFAAVLIKRHSEFAERHFKLIAGISALFLFAVQMLFLQNLRFEPTFDLEAIYRSAIELAEGRDFTAYSSETCHSNYFYIFPNNLGGMSFLAVIFKISGLLGIKDYFTVASVVNSLLSAGTMLIVSLICKKLFGALGGVFALLLFLISPPFYLIAPVFYTDSLSLIFPSAAFLALIYARESSSIKRRAFLYFLSAVLCFVGALLKMTVLIFAIAAVVYFALRRAWKDLLLFGVITAVTVSVMLAAFNGIVYSKYLDKEKAEQMNTPVYYWIDLAFHGNGGYDNSIFSMSVNESDPEHRRQLLKEDIKEGIEELGISGIYELFERKSAATFGDGTFALSDFLDDRPEDSGPVQEFVTYGGKYYFIYCTVCTAVFLAILTFMIISVSFDRKDNTLMIPQLSVFGIMFFLLFWEQNSRYITTFVPFIFICAVGGICKTAAFLEKRPGLQKYFKIR